MVSPRNDQVVPPAIGIFGHYGNLNLGDEAIIAAVIQNVRRRLPRAKLYGFSINPTDTERRHGLPSFPIRYVEKNTQASDSGAPQHRLHGKHPPSHGKAAGTHRMVESLRGSIRRIPGLRRLFHFVYQSHLLASVYLPREFKFLVKSYRVLKGIDLLLIAGSNQFLDNFGGPLGFPYTLLKWAIMAKLAGTKLAYVSVGAGPLGSRLSRLLVRTALLFSDYTSFRDSASQRLIEAAGFRDQCRVYPDLAHSLLFTAKPATEECAKNGGRLPVVGINMMPMYDSRYWCIHDANKYQEYLRKVAVFAATLLQAKYPVFFFATQAKDEDVIADVLNLLRQENSITEETNGLIRHSHTVDELMNVLHSADLIVATRFHGTVLALLAEKPVLGICYYRKTKDLLQEMDQGDYAVELETLNTEELLRKFQKLEANRQQTVAKIRQKNAEYRDALLHQYDLVLGKLMNCQ